MPKAYPFFKRYRLSVRAKIQEIFSQGRFTKRGPFKFKYLTENQTSFQLVISISKRVGNSPTRNRIKRLIREAFRQRGELDERPVALAVFLNSPLNEPPNLRQVEEAIEHFYRTAFP